MNKTQKIAVIVELTDYEVDVATGYAEERGETLEEFLSNEARKCAREIAAQSELDDDVLSEEELREFNNDYFDDREADSLRDQRRYE
tara:strand:- start:363 stop:623 length:261 start_codon:yes stop_codon:yes gene_type:complete